MHIKNNNVEIALELDYNIMKVILCRYKRMLL
jgi:hypothetical protein